MTVLLVLSTIVLVGLLVGLATFVVTRIQHGAPPLPPRKIDPLATVPEGPTHPTKLQVEDVVTFRGADYMVRERVDFEETGFRWFEVLLDSNTDKFWLEVENNEGDLHLTRWAAFDVSLADGHLSNHVTYLGHDYRLREAGTARFWSNGLTGLPASGSMAYRSFGRTGGAMVSFDKWTEQWEAAAGTRVEPFELSIMTRSR
jgi:hypothetical protein